MRYPDSSVGAPCILYQLGDLLHREVDRLNTLLNPLLELLGGGKHESLWHGSSRLREQFGFSLWFVVLYSIPVENQRSEPYTIAERLS